jgi:serine/threonine protein kinase
VAQAAFAVSPQRFGRYILLDRIGEGGMAEVFRAIMPGAEGFKRTLVVKRILSRFSESSAFVEMFVREARIGALLNHPNIVGVYDFGSVEGHYFLAMEYVRGRDLHAVVRRLIEKKRVFPVAAAAFVAHEVARALAYAHALTGSDGRPLHIVHRDVSPSNVMCLREGGVKLLDFGIASAVAEVAPQEREEGSFQGKLGYMAPERLRNRPHDGRSDLYALGVVLWEMLTCRRLFQRPSDEDTVRGVLEKSVDPPSSRRPDVPASLDGIVMRALERDPEKRFPNAQAMADELEEVLRETKFKSKMLPGLLYELFGADLRSTQVPVSALAPELLGEADINVSSLSVTPLSVFEPWKFWRRGFWSTRSWRMWTVAGLVIGASGFSAGMVARAQSAPIVTAPVAPPPVLAPVPPPVLAPVPAAVPPTPVEVSTEATPALTKRAKRARANADANLIQSGRSIDPFAEARGRR